MFSLLTKQSLKRICSKGEEEGVRESINILELLPYLQGLLLCVWLCVSLCVCVCVCVYVCKREISWSLQPL